VAVALRNAAGYREILSEAPRLAAALGVPPQRVLPLFVSYGAPPPKVAAARAAAAAAALRALLPAAAGGDVAGLLLHPAARWRGDDPGAPAASLAAAADALGLSPYRVLQTLVRDAERAAAGRHAGGSGGDGSHGDEATPAAGAAPSGRVRPGWPFLLMPAARLRARADAVGELLGVAGPRRAALLRGNPFLLAQTPESVRAKALSLAGFLTGVDGAGVPRGGGGGSATLSLKDEAPAGGGGQPPPPPPGLHAAAWAAAAAVLRRCPKLLQLDVSTCVERVRALEAALKLRGDAAWAAALREPSLMLQPRARLRAAAAWLQALAGGAAGARAVVQQDPRVLVSMGQWMGAGAPAAPGAAGRGALADEAGGDEASDRAADGGDGGSSWRAAEAAPGAGGAAPSTRAPAARLAWLAHVLGTPEADALAAAVRAPAGRLLVFGLSAATGEARLRALADLMGLEPRAALEAALGGGLTFWWVWTGRFRPPQSAGRTGQAPAAAGPRIHAAHAPPPCAPTAARASRRPPAPCGRSLPPPPPPPPSSAPQPPAVSANRGARRPRRLSVRGRRPGGRAARAAPAAAAPLSCAAAAAGGGHACPAARPPRGPRPAALLARGRRRRRRGQRTHPARGAHPFRPGRRRHQGRRWRQGRGGAGGGPRPTGIRRCRHTAAAGATARGAAAPRAQASPAGGGLCAVAAPARRRARQRARGTDADNGCVPNLRSGALTPATGCCRGGPLAQPHLPTPTPLPPADDARHDRLRFLLATRLATTAGARGGAVSMAAALLASEEEFARRFPGHAAFASALASARAAQGTAGPGTPALLRVRVGARAGAAASPALLPPASAPAAEARAAAEGVVLDCLRTAATEGFGGGSCGGVPTHALLAALREARGLGKSRAYLILEGLRARGAVECLSAGGTPGGGRAPRLWRLAAAPASAAGAGGV
jgi:hypothetical protein